jgi:hypothetical protein
MGWAVWLLIVLVPIFGCAVWLSFPGWQGGLPRRRRAVAGSDRAGVVASFLSLVLMVVVRLTRAGR